MHNEITLSSLEAVNSHIAACEAAGYRVSQSDRSEVHATVLLHRASDGKTSLVSWEAPE